MTAAVLDAGPLYSRFRRGDEPARALGLQIHRVPYDASSTAQELDHPRLPENDVFDFPLFLPGDGRFDEVVVILNGLNDNSYRKFFPWAASLACSGTPALLFPSALLMNRRPRAWITPSATQVALDRRMLVAPESATLFNAVLSDRVAAEPLSLLQDALRTCADLRRLQAQVASGELRLASGGRPFASGTRCHLLGYSLGGYIALALRLHEASFDNARVLCLNAGASVGGNEHERLAPVSPLILDRPAADRLLREIELSAMGEFDLGTTASLLLELFSGTCEATRGRIRALDDQLTVVGGHGDRIVPAPGIASNLGRLDATLECATHEYPFNRFDPTAAGATREIARSYRVEPCFEAEFLRFVGLARSRLCGGTVAACPREALAPHATADAR